jgi:hypothetical protein
MNDFVENCHNLVLRLVNTPGYPDVVHHATKLLHGTNAAIAAADVSSPKHLIYSALPPMKNHSKGKYSSGGYWIRKLQLSSTVHPARAAGTFQKALSYLPGRLQH